MKKVYKSGEEEVFDFYSTLKQWINSMFKKILTKFLKDIQYLLPVNNE
jgi:hypothetical protein